MSEQDHSGKSPAERRLRQIEERLEQSQQLETLGRLTRGAAHDFNNILSSVVGNASLAPSYREVSGEVRQSLEDITRAAQRASRLARQLLACSGRPAGISKRQDLSHLIAGMDALIEASVPKHLRVDYELASELPLVDMDPSALTRALINLVINGSEACEDLGGVVRVSTAVVTRDGGRFVQLSLSDDGAGMDRRTREQMFEPFFSTRAPGRGVGLDAVVALVKGHQGAVEVESEPGQGTTVRLLFPT